MDIKNLINSKPDSLENKNRQVVGEWVIKSGGGPNTKCIDIILRKNNLGRFIKKVGEYNFRQVKETKNENKPEKVYTKNYSGNCPRGWKMEQIGFCMSDSYKGSCDSGRKICNQELVPTGKTLSEDYYENNSNRVESNYPDGYTKFKNLYNKAYVRILKELGEKLLVESVDTLQKFEVSKNELEPYNLFDNNRIKKTKQVPIVEYKETCKTQPAQSIWQWGNDMDKKIDFEKKCGVSWPTEDAFIQEDSDCNYGKTLEDYVREGSMKVIGNAKDAIEAASFLLKKDNLSVKIPKFFGIGKGNVYVAGDGKDNLFVGNGKYNGDCGVNNYKVDLYEIDFNLYNRLKECNEVNGLINDAYMNIEGFREEEGRDWKYLLLLMVVLVGIGSLYFFRRK